LVLEEHEVVLHRYMDQSLLRIKLRQCDSGIDLQETATVFRLLVTKHAAGTRTNNKV
jgi:hypothetical protein